MLHNHTLESNTIQNYSFGVGTRKHHVVSMFSGCGGMDLGFLGGFEFLGSLYPRHPFQFIWANDLNPYAVETYRKNINQHIRLGSIWDVMDTLPRNKDVDVVVGGFPCQDISVNGKGLGIDGARSGLYRAMVEAVKVLCPKVFVAENVKGLLMKHNTKSLDIVINDFSKLGYDVTYQLYNAANYGVPQSRERVFIVGTAQGIEKFSPPAPTHKSNAWITAEMALSDLENFDEESYHNHIWSKAQKSPEQGSRFLKADRPAYTIRAECHGNIQWHYKLSRRISMREAARIQSFPDNFIFYSKLRETERQIGNAVPPVLAWNIANAVKKII